MNPDLTAPNCLQYRLPKNISRQEEQTICFGMSAAYVEVHFRQDFFMKTNNINPDLTDLCPYCWQ